MPRAECGPLRSAAAKRPIVRRRARRHLGAPARQPCLSPFPPRSGAETAGSSQEPFERLAVAVADLRPGRDTADQLGDPVGQRQLLAAEGDVAHDLLARAAEATAGASELKALIAEWHLDPLNLPALGAKAADLPALHLGEPGQRLLEAARQRLDRQRQIGPAGAQCRCGQVEAAVLLAGHDMQANAPV